MVQALSNWWTWIGRRLANDRRPWALIGKGPTFAQRELVDWSRFQTLGLNHVIRELDVDVAHVIDVDVIEDVPLERWRRAAVVVMPFRPHVNCRPNPRSLLDHARRSRTLRALIDDGQVVYYNLALGGKPADCTRRRGTAVGVRYFSSEAAANLLLGAGVRRLSLCGIDGRDSYAADFDDLRPFANGRTTFDDGIAELQRIVRRSRAAVDRVPFITGKSTQARLYRDLILQTPNYGSTNHGADAVPLLRQFGARSVLDVGCGHNAFARELRRDGIVAWGADIANPWADILAEAHDLRFPDRSFDWITAFDVLEHVERDTLPAVLAEFRRVATRGFVVSIGYGKSETPGPNGEQLHATIGTPRWWRCQLELAAERVTETGGFLVGEFGPPAVQKPTSGDGD